VPPPDLELGDEDSVGMVTSNLVPADQLKKKQVVFSGKFMKCEFLT
jgi:hypothetical protein